MAAKSRTPYRDAAEKTFRHGVDVDIPGMGLGRADDAMRAWPAGQGVAPADWEMHGYRGFVRVYFRDEKTAHAFRIKFGGRQWAVEGLDDLRMIRASAREAARRYF
ncbi:hypothetical protein [Nisaea sediminum]|uniref:hypothetical protein n=1 Tax=Nisaea sediminum TaxID=2775867 RepID=UPI0018675E3E|nr:hypothetical protein [Nisaea sediminum]